MMQDESMPDDQHQLATKADLVAMAAGMATKADLVAMAAGMASKADLAAMATKADLADLKDTTQNDLKKFRRDMAKEILKTRAESAESVEKLSALIMQTRSDVLQACENAVFKAEKVDRDQALTRNRLDRIEARVTSLESRRRRS